MKHTIYIVLFTLFISACSNKEVNNFIIPQENLIPVLVDFHIVDAASKQGVISNNRNNYIRHSHYNGILESFKIERTRFDSTMRYYAERPEEHKLLYEKVEAQLIKKLEKNQFK